MAQAKSTSDTAVQVMLVEDDPQMLGLLQTLLQLEGFRVIASQRNQSLADVLGLIQRELPAVVVLDAHLHQFSGFELLSRIRREPGLEKVRVLMTSGVDLTEQAMREGADDFLLKPFMPDDIIHKISLFVAESR